MPTSPYLSPTINFLAVKRKTLFEEIRARGAELVRQTNQKVSEQAVKYVYGTDDSQLHFIANHLGKKLRSSPLDW